MSDSVAAAAPAEDPRLALIYQESLRGLLQQQSAVESLRNRAGTLIFAASFASSLLGSKALADGVDPWDWVAIVMLFGIGALTVVLLWPYYAMTFRFDPQLMLDRYIDDDNPATMTQMHRELALQIESDRQANGRVVRRMRETFEVALVLLLLNILAWLISIATIPT
jgi:hypothetical protein